jgi:hypothetical protein
MKGDEISNGQLLTLAKCACVIWRDPDFTLYSPEIAQLERFGLVNNRGYPNKYGLELLVARYHELPTRA